MVTITDDPPTVSNQVCMYNVSVSLNVCYVGSFVPLC